MGGAPSYEISDNENNNSLTPLSFKNINVNFLSASKNQQKNVVEVKGQKLSIGIQD